MSEQTTTKIPLVTVSTPVVFLPAGQMNQARPAIVDETLDEGVINLQMFNKWGGGTTKKIGIRHMEDPRNKTDAASVGKTGVWLSAREFAERKQREVEDARDRERQRHIARMKNQNERIVRLAEENMPISQIAAQVGVSPTLVEQTLENTKVPVPQDRQQVPETAGA